MPSSNSIARLEQTEATVETLTQRIEELEQLVASLAMPKPEETPKKASAKTNKDGKERKKRGSSGYNLFTKDISETVREELIEASEHGKLGRGELLSEISRRWKALSDEERTIYNDRAAEAKKTDDIEEESE